MTHTRFIRITNDHTVDSNTHTQQHPHINNMSAMLHNHLAGDRILWAVGELELIFGEIEYVFQATPSDKYESITLTWVLEQMGSTDSPMAKVIAQMLHNNGYHNRSEAHVIELIEALIDNFGGGLKGYERALSRVFEKEPISYVSDIIAPLPSPVHIPPPSPSPSSSLLNHPPPTSPPTLDINIPTPPYCDSGDGSFD